MAQEHTYKFNVTMTCTGCSGAVDRALSKLPGVKSKTVDLASDSVVVTTEGDVTYETVLDKIAKTGKKITRGEADGVVRLNMATA